MSYRNKTANINYRTTTSTSSGPYIPPSDRITPSSSPSESSSTIYLPPIRIPSFHNNNNNHNETYSRQMYPTSAPYKRPATPDAEHTRVRLPAPITSCFANGYASPANSTYSSSPGSRDEIDYMDLTSGVHLAGPHTNGRDATEEECPSGRRWHMKDFNLVQTVGTPSL
jgi:hypothetical protein